MAKSQIKNKITKGARAFLPQISGVELAFILIIAILNDLTDIIGLNLLLFRVLDLITGGILGFWSYFRSSKAQKYLYQYLGTFLIEMIPLLGDILPGWTFFVLYIYRQNKKQNSNTNQNE